MAPQFNRRKRIDNEKAMELYNRGLCDPDVAEKLGVSRDAVREWRKRNGLEGHKAPPKPKKEKQKTYSCNLVKMAVEARKHGMSYGQYMAMRYEKSRGGKNRKVSN